MPRPIITLMPLLALAGACSGGHSPATRPGEDRQLDEAAATLDANSVDANAAEIVDESEDGGANDSAQDNRQ